GRRRGATRDLPGRPERHHPLRVRDRPVGRPQPVGSAARSRCAADRRAVPLQLEAGRRDLEGGLMSLDALKASLPDYAKDLRLNLDSVLSEGGAQGLELRQLRAVALASAIASRHQPLVEALAGVASESLAPAEIVGVRAAAA